MFIIGPSVSVRLDIKLGIQGQSKFTILSTREYCQVLGQTIRTKYKTISVDIIQRTVHDEVFTSGALEVQVLRLSAFSVPAGNSDVWQIMSTHKGSFVFIIHPTQKCPLVTI